MGTDEDDENKNKTDKSFNVLIYFKFVDAILTSFVTMNCF